jgi:hypothetical protein
MFRKSIPYFSDRKSFAATSQGDDAIGDWERRLHLTSVLSFRRSRHLGKLPR